MSNYLKIYDFIISHDRTGTNTNFFTLATNHPGLVSLFSIDGQVAPSIQRQVVFDSFLRKFSSDLNSEILKNEPTKKIVKKSRYYDDSGLIVRDIEKDYANKNLYGILHAGKITSNAILEKRNENENSNPDYEYESLNGDRIYDDFFFLLHISFDCNIARLFVLTQKSNTNVDAILKKYFKDNLFKATRYKKTKALDFIPEHHRNAVLNRSIVSGVIISKAETIISESDGIEYDVEIKLKPRTAHPFSQVTERIVSAFKKSKVMIEDEVADDENSEIKFNIKDTVNNTSKTISFGSQDNFMPRLVLEDSEILDDNGQIDVEKLRGICADYIVYENNTLV